MENEQTETQEPVLQIAGRTDRGTIRPVNEDAYAIMEARDLPHWCAAMSAVFDGVGGLGYGQEASAKAASYLGDLIHEQKYANNGHLDYGEMLSDVICQIHGKLRLDASKDPRAKNMSTTATVAFLPRKQPWRLWIGFVGDSPVLRIREGSIETLGAPDSLVDRLVREGVITREEARHHPRRHVITQALGYYEFVTPHIICQEVQPGDQFIICTDGLTTMLTEKTILENVDEELPQRTCSELINAANAAGGHDNITVVTMKF